MNDNLNETLLENESNKKEINNLENTLVIFEQKTVETAKVIENLEKKLAKGTEAQKSLMKSLEEKTFGMDKADRDLKQIKGEKKAIQEDLCKILILMAKIH